MNDKAKKTPVYLVALLLTAPVVLLYAVLFLNSISGEMVGIFPNGLTLKHWESILPGEIKVLGSVGQYYPNLYLAMSNTLMLAVTVAGIEVIFSSLAGYVISRYKFKARFELLATILILHSFPGITLLVALFYMLNMFGLFDTLIGVITIKVALDLPLGVWIMKGFFDGVSWELEMSALVDGCSRLGAWRKVVMPNARNGLMAVIIFGFLSGWSEFIYILTFITSQKYWTFSMLIYALTTTEYSYINPGVVAAAAIIYMTPPAFFFLFAQKFLLRITIAGKAA